MTLLETLAAYREAETRRTAARMALATASTALQEAKTQAVVAEQVRTFFNALSEQQRKELETRIQTLVDYGVRMVFGEAYRFVVRSELKGKSVRTEFFLVDHGIELSLLDATGGGIGDVVAFLLRVVMLCLIPGQRRVLILDEPFKFVSTTHFQRLEALMQELTAQLGLQILMVTHKTELIDAATTLVRVTKGNGPSHAEIEQIAPA